MFFKRPVQVPPSFEDELLERIREINAKWQEAMRIATARAYIEGHAAGELAGRQALALELQVAHGKEGGERPMTEEELETLATRQLH